MLTNTQFRVLVNELAEAKRRRAKVGQPSDPLSALVNFLFLHLFERPASQMIDRLFLDPLGGWMQNRNKKAPQSRASM